MQQKRYSSNAVSACPVAWNSCYVDTLKSNTTVHTHHSVSSFCHKTPVVNKWSRGKCEHPFLHIVLVAGLVSLEKVKAFRCEEIN